MPNAANFTVKDSSNADTAFTSVTPASGNSPAVYFARAKGSASAFQPKLQISSKGISNSGREVKITFGVPYTVTDQTGAEKVIDTEFFEIRKISPGRVPQNLRNDSTAWIANILDVVQVRDALNEGYAPA